MDKQETAPAFHSHVTVLQSESWPHAPTHRLCKNGTYFVTVGTYKKQHFFHDTLRLDVLQRGLLKLAKEYNWQLEAWCCFSNHYHFVAHSPEDGAESLKTMLQNLHSKLAKWINKLDNEFGRQIWHNYWDTRLTNEKSYYARLKYTHNNAVHHGIVSVAHLYKWCSATWFLQNATPAQIKTMASFDISTVKIKDDFCV